MKNSIRRLLSVILVVSMLVACGKSSDSKEENDKISIELSWWGNDARHTYTMDAVDGFVDDNDDINVIYRYGEWSGYERKTNVWMKSNNQADVMQINYAWLSLYSADGEGYYDLYKLGDYIDLSAFDQSELAYGEVNGKLNAIPIAFNTSNVCYNKEIFEKYGLEYPKTWDDLFETSKVLSKDNIYVLGMAKKHVLLMLIAYYEQTTGKHVFDENGEMLLDKEDIGIMLDFYKRLLDEKVLLPIDQFDRKKFGKGEFAGSMFWVSDADNYCKELENNGYTAVFHSYPMAEDAKLTGLYMKPATMYAISSITKHPEESAKLLDFLLNGEKMVKLQGTEKGVPVSKTAVSILVDNNMLTGYGYDSYMQMQNDKALMGIMIPAMENESFLDIFKNDADAYIYDIKTREETINQIYKDIK